LPASTIGVYGDTVTEKQIKKAEKIRAEKAKMRAEEAVVIAKKYYEDGMSEEEIAKERHLSRPTVHRILTEAKEKGLFRVRVLSTSSAHSIFEMRSTLKILYPHLKSIHIAPADDYFDKESQSHDHPDSDGAHTRRLLDVALLSSKIFLLHLRELSKETPAGEKSVVAVGPGELIELTINEMAQEPFPNLRVVPTNGYLYQHQTAYSANQIGSLLSKKISSGYDWLPSIGIMEKEHVKLVKKLPVIGETLNIIPSTKLVLTGVRPFRKDDMTRYKALFPNQIEEYEAEVAEGITEQPLGLLCDHPFTDYEEGKKTGEWTPKTKKHKVIGLELETIQSLVNDENGTVILTVASNEPNRTKALRAALKFKYCNVLIIDERAAHDLIALEDRTTTKS
jgi:deoxyribonucleoside regulator